MSRFVYSPRHVVDIGDHVFPTEKFRLTAGAAALLGSLVEPPEPSREDLLLAHDESWVDQGNGTAAIFAGDPEVFTFSMHQEDLYPPVKERSSLDVGLPAGTGDLDYLRRLRDSLPEVFAHKPELVVYQAGVDCWEGDILGGFRCPRPGCSSATSWSMTNNVNGVWTSN